MNEYPKSIDRLLRIMHSLRNECPWDKKQTLASLRPQPVEELYELIDAIDQKDWQNIKEELGDMLLHIVFYSKIAEEENQFDFGAVIQSICDKLVRRHPHIYDQVIVQGEEDVKKNWEQLKKQEGKKSIFAGISQSMPAMDQAVSIQKKARQAGFHWEHKNKVWEKVLEEIAELKEAEATQDEERIIDEMGDVFFSLINYARYIHIDPVQSLQRCNHRFVERYSTMEKIARAHNLDLQDMNLSAMEAIWQEAKEKLKNVKK